MSERERGEGVSERERGGSAQRASPAAGGRWSKQPAPRRPPQEARTRLRELGQRSAAQLRRRTEAVGVSFGECGGT